MLQVYLKINDTKLAGLVQSGILMQEQNVLCGCGNQRTNLVGYLSSPKSPFILRSFCICIPGCCKALFAPSATLAPPAIALLLVLFPMEGLLYSYLPALNI